MTTKSTAEHTPGKWYLGVNGVDVYAEGGEHVAHIFYNGPYTSSEFHSSIFEGIAQERARLIAAAPETAAERDRLREENASLQEALEEVIKEVSWFVARKKNLAEIVAAEILVGADGVKVWANVLDEDLDIARAALARHAKAEGGHDPRNVP